MLFEFLDASGNLKLEIVEFRELKKRNVILLSTVLEMIGYRSSQRHALHHPQLVTYIHAFSPIGRRGDALRCRRWCAEFVFA